MNADAVLILVRKNLGNGAAMESSARQCLADAIECQNRGDEDGAKKRGIDALRFLVGVFGVDYKKAVQ